MPAERDAVSRDEALERFKAAHAAAKERFRQGWAAKVTVDLATASDVLSRLEEAERLAAERLEALRLDLLALADRAHNDAAEERAMGCAQAASFRLGKEEAFRRAAALTTPTDAPGGRDAG